MQTLKINTSRALNGYAAWLDGKPLTRATSLDSEQRAAQKLALKVFGHSRTGQIDEEMLSRIVVKRMGSGGTFLATYDAPKTAGKGRASL